PSQHPAHPPQLRPGRPAARRPGSRRPRRGRPLPRHPGRGGHPERGRGRHAPGGARAGGSPRGRSEEHTSELQSRFDLVCRLLPPPAPPAISPLSLHDALPISHLSTPLTLLSSDRDALLRGDPGAAAPGEDARYLVTRAGAVTLSEGEDGTLRAVLEHEDPREGAQQPLVLLGRREGYRVLAAEIGEPSAELDAPGRDLRDLRRVADRLADSDADLAAAAVAMGAWHRSTRHCPQCGGVLEPEMAGWVLRCRED